MPILAPEINLHPADLLERAGGASGDLRWWVLYTLSRQEKQLMRRLHLFDIPFYSPLVRKKQRSPAGRFRESYVPLFSNYVFVLGGEDDRQSALKTNCVANWMAAADTAALTHDLRQIQRLIEIGAPLTPERRLEGGERVRVRSGPFRGFEGTVLRRDGETRLLVAVNFLQQGASVLLEDCQLERLD
ncbi:MAG TPA: transcription termination/antitermination NusG family protein [Pirellulales bacterium]|jgi:transcriptional antiterminator RfaH|nr:transcription termination/antitermination NusG family protein [Pirellulales bacterium]HEX4142740.1 transcription termination/antitermination NusG family protein [Pirellulales bacterium]